MRARWKWIIGLMLAVLLFVNLDYLNSVLRSSLEGNDDSPVATPARNPLILLHGFNPTYNKRLAEFSLRELQEQLVDDLNFTDRGILTSETKCGELQAEGAVIVRASYFEWFEHNQMEDYAANVGEMIELLRSCSGAQRVDIIAYSMGGLITRYFLLENDVAGKLIMVATPNSGELYATGAVAEFLGDISPLDFDFMQVSNESDFVQEISARGLTGASSYYTIAGVIDDTGDGLVPMTAVAVDGAQNVAVKCDHVSIKNPGLCPDAYGFIENWLQGS